LHSPGFGQAPRGVQETTQKAMQINGSNPMFHLKLLNRHAGRDSAPRDATTEWPGAARRVCALVELAPELPPASLNVFTQRLQVQL
jgi:hypothetical protein